MSLNRQLTNDWYFKIKKCLMKNTNIFQQVWFFRSNLYMLQKIRWFVTWWIDSSIISLDSNLTRLSPRRQTAQKMRFSIKDFFSKCDQIPRKLRIWLHLLKNSLMKNLIFCAVTIEVEKKEMDQDFDAFQS